MSTLIIQFHEKKISLNICLFELLEEFRRDSKEFKLALVNKPSVFKLLRFDCTYR